MPDPLLFLTSQDVEEIRSMRRRIDELELRRPNFKPDRDLPNQETYVVRVPDGGIPALSTGSSPNSGTGTGASAFGADLPGQAQCEVYQLAQVDGIGTPVLMPTDGQLVTVNNLTRSPLSAGRWLAITRDKFGDWYALTEESSGGDGIDAAIWANCRLNGSIVDVLANVEISRCVQISADTYHFLFDRNFIQRERFTVCGIIANNDYFYEDYSQRTSDSCVMKTASGTAPVSHFGITVHGSQGVPSIPEPLTGTGTGAAGIQLACCENATLPPTLALCITFDCGTNGLLTGTTITALTTATYQTGIYGPGYYFDYSHLDPNTGITFHAFGALDPCGLITSYEMEGWTTPGVPSKGALHGGINCVGGVALDPGLFTNQWVIEALTCSPFSIKMQASGYATLKFSTDGSACINPVGTGTGPTVVTSCCPGVLIPPQLEVTLSDYPPLGPACPITKKVLTYSPTGVIGEGWYSAPFICNGDSHQVVFYCSGSNVWDIGFYINGNEFFTATGPTTSCDPLLVQGTFAGGGFDGITFIVQTIIDCPCGPLPMTACAVLTNLSGCPCVDGTQIDLVNVDGVLTPISSPSFCGTTQSIAVRCFEGKYLLDFTSPPGGSNLTTISCSPLHLRAVYTDSVSENPCHSAGSSFVVDIYENPCVTTTGTGTGTGTGGGGGLWTMEYGAIAGHVPSETFSPSFPVSGTTSGTPDISGDSAYPAVAYRDLGTVHNTVSVTFVYNAAENAAAQGGPLAGLRWDAVGQSGCYVLLWNNGMFPVIELRELSAGWSFVQVQGDFVLSLTDGNSYTMVITDSGSTITVSITDDSGPQSIFISTTLNASKSEVAFGWANKQTAGPKTFTSTVISAVGAM